MTSPVRIDREGRVAVVVIDNPPVNATSHAVRAGLLAAVREADADQQIAAAVLMGAGSTFVAGADIREFGKPLEEPQMPAVIAAIMDSPKPFVAALHGSALGGGFELALACDSRIAAPGAQVGLPEVSLGMIPGAGGTQHLPRIVGVAAAIEIICSGRRIKADEAVRMGLVGRIAEGELRAAAIREALAMGEGKCRLRDLFVPSDEPSKIEAAAQAALEAGNRRPQVQAAIDVIKAAATLPYAQAIAREREVFQRLRNSTEAAALRHLFFAERAAAKIPAEEAARAREIIGRRILAAYRREAELLVEEGASADDIGAAMAAFGFAAEPFPRSRPATARGGGSFTRESIQRRLLTAMAREGRALLEEGLVPRASDVDLELAQRHGFPRHEGGPLFWAARTGIAELS